MKYAIGVKLRYYRILRGMSQKEFANQIGVSNTRVSNWEQGINRPDADTLCLICQTLRVSADELLDIQLPDSDLNEVEKQIIMKFRNRPDLRKAVCVLLGIPSEE